MKITQEIDAIIACAKQMAKFSTANIDIIKDGATFDDLVEIGKKYEAKVIKGYNTDNYQIGIKGSNYLIIVTE
jgi:hypothetical protein